MTLLSRWMPFWLYAIVLPVLVVAAWLLYRRDRRILGTARGTILTVLRLVTVSILTTVLLDLSTTRTRTETIEDTVLVVVDASRSMSLPADSVVNETGDETSKSRPSRFAAALTFLRTNLLPRLDERYEVTLHLLGNELETIGRTSALDAASPTRDTSNLVAPIADEVARRPRDSVAGVVLITDGRHNGPRPAIPAAEVLGELGAPLVTIPVGPNERPSDLAVVSLEAKAVVFTGDEVDAEVVLDNTGVARESLELWIRDGERELGSFVIDEQLPQGVSRWPVSFAIDSPGRRKIRVEIETSGGEASVENNLAHTWIDVLDDRARVLLIDRSARWEFRYLRDSWERDERIDLDDYLLSAPPERKLPDDAPRTREKLFEYDAIVLGDIDAETFTSEEQQILADFVRARGGTLLLLSGSRAMPYSWERSALAEILPVELERPTPPRRAGTRLSTDAWELSLASAGEDSTITRLVAGRERNVELWTHLPGPHWHSPIRAAHESSTVLVDSAEDEHPIFAIREIGVGRVFFSAIDSTWRWRFRFGDLLYRRFWGNVIRWARSERWAAKDDFVRLGSDHALYAAADTVELAALIEDEQGNPIEAGQVDAILSIGESRRRIPMQLVPQSRGRFRLEIPPALIEEMSTESSSPSESPDAETLEFQVRLVIESLPSYSEREDRAVLSFAVASRARRELLDFAADRELLREVATRSSGALVEISQGDRVFEHLRQDQRTREITTTSAAIDYTTALAIGLLALLSLEWILRKRWNLA